MAKLTTRQRAALKAVAARDGHLTGWCIGTPTANALRKRGLVSNGPYDARPFESGWRNNGYVYITPAGRAALSQQDKTQEAPHGRK